MRDDTATAVPVDAILPGGDVVTLSAGPFVPADGILLTACDFNVSESALSGETFPVMKTPGFSTDNAQIRERSNTVFAGTTVRSGKADMLIVLTGDQTDRARRLSSQVVSKHLSTGADIDVHQDKGRSERQKGDEPLGCRETVDASVRVEGIRKAGVRRGTCARQ